ncbi:MAG: hypothetical protein K2H76_07190 [Muribaculaceae bacterium]|nr:hypothetical protein [Muribaculaceae bacterium]
MTPEEIKKTWAEASRKMYKPTPEEFENMYREKKETALERLATKYRRFSTMGFVMAIVSVFWMFSPTHLADTSLKFVMSIVLMLYFATCSSIDWWLYRGVSSINCFDMSVSEVVSKALYYRKKHLQSIMFLIPFAVVVFGVMIYSFNADRFIIYGMAAGLILGLALGYRQFREFMDEYKVISKE